MIDENLAQAFGLQIHFCSTQGSPFSARVLMAVRETLGTGGVFDRILSPWRAATARQMVQDAAVLRVLGGLNRLVLTGAAPALAANYPPNAGYGDAALATAVQAAGEAHEAALVEFVRSPPQTNEVRRSLCLTGGFLTVAHETGLPLRCLELGASAGLNTMWDRFHYTFGDHHEWGAPSSPVRLAAESWTGGAPPFTAEAVVAERAACDQNPIDVNDEAAALRLLFYVWPDQTERVARIRAAIALARATGVSVARADAGDWGRLHAHPKPGVATVLYHSVFWQYPPEATREALREIIAAAGRAATPEAPFAWLRMEPDLQGADADLEVRLTLWPGGEDRLLARVHPHGATVDWRAPETSSAA